MIRVGRLTSDDRSLIWNLRQTLTFYKVTCLQSGGIFSNGVITNFLLILTVKEC